MFMNYKQHVIIQSCGPRLSEHLFSLQQELMGAEISGPSQETCPSPNSSPPSAAKGKECNVKCAKEL